jgi:hypothetical protein
VPLPLPEPTATSGDSALAVFKIPTTSYDVVYARLATLGTVLGRERSSQDVTSQVVDLNSRIRSAQASVDRVNALMKQATSLNDVVALEAALTQRESDLESMESQLTALQGQVAMSTVSVELFEQAKPVAATSRQKPRGAWASAGHAVLAGWHTLYLIGRGLLVALSACLPFLFILVPAGYLTYRVRRRRPAPPAEAEE